MSLFEAKMFFKDLTFPQMILSSKLSFAGLFGLSSLAEDSISELRRAILPPSLTLNNFILLTSVLM
ncbi:MAG: hypothetical protein BWY32_03555 [bacterium ADurb.Bin243]|nr:MAG: hypothetical protein BWY32_03555 [bacterium ADurb.Bin243]